MTKGTKTKRSIEYIKHVFSTEEKEQMAGEMALSLSEKEAAEQKLKEVQKQIKAEIEAHQTKISTLSKHYSNGYAYRHVDCEMVYDFDSKTVDIFRVDTGEKVSSRPIKQNELEMDMFDDYAITAEEESE